MLVIFDFDGTLCDTRSTIVTTMRRTMEEMSIEVATEERCASTIGLKLADCFRAIYPDMTEERAEECATTYRRIFEESKRAIKPGLFPHVYETIVKLVEAGHRISIASSRSEKSLREFVEETGLEGKICYLVGADNVEKAKPDPEPVLKTLAALGEEAGDAIVVGDMPVDIIMGKRAGVSTIGVTYGNSSREEIEGAGAEWVVDDIATVVGIVESIGGR